MNLTPEARQTLQETFKLDAFRAGQEQVIGNLLAGRSAAAVFPTGGGKSLCYQLPALLLPGVTIVVSPLIALMKEQVERLRSLGIAASSLDSTLSGEEVRHVMADLRTGTIKLLYLSPERFNNERTREALLRLRVSLFAVDEAHCISEWGHNFRPDYLKLARFARRCQAERILALTATATPEVLGDISRGFDIAPEAITRTGFHRPNLRLYVTPAAGDRDQILESHLRERLQGAAIVYVTRQQTAEDLAKRLTTSGFKARCYHAGLPPADRASIQDWFAASSEAIVVATIAFGMGIDKSDIRAVYHYNLPKSLENYSQEIGRAGRDGEPADCEMLVSPEDLARLENFAYGDTPTLSAVRGLLQEVLGGADDLALNLYELGNTHDLRPSVLTTLLTYLELDGYLESGTPIYSRYQFQPLATSAEILDRFEGERREFLEILFRQATKARTWFTLDIDQTAQATGSTRERVVRAVDYLTEQNLLTVRVDGLRHRYRKLRAPADGEALATELQGRMVQRESREIGRIRQVMAFAGLDGCQADYLGAYFGEPLVGRCGRCSWCRNGGNPVMIPGRFAASIAPDLWDKALAFSVEHTDLRAEPRLFARFLCGLPSPRLQQRKLTRHALFGVLEDEPFAEVLQTVEEALR